MSNKKVIVSGGNGQLGTELRLAKNIPELDIVVLDRNQLDISNQADMIAWFRSEKPDYFVNCAAYTQVDQAEEDLEKAFEVNAFALKDLASICNEHSCTLLHISTDYVYNHNPGRALKEDDKTLAKGVYAESKLQGEKFIQELANNYIIIRTSWVYSGHGKNFVDTMLSLGKKYDSLKIVSDQIGTPSYTRDIAAAILRIIQQIGDSEKPLKEIYNYSNGGQTTWFDFAAKIFDLADISCKLQKVSTEEFGAKAHRPKWSVLSKDKIIQDYDINIPFWEDSLIDYLKEYKNIK